MKLDVKKKVMKASVLSTNTIFSFVDDIAIIMYIPQ